MPLHSIQQQSVPLIVPQCCTAVLGCRTVLQLSLCSSLEPGRVRPGKVNELFVYDNFSRVPVEEVQAGDICAVTGIQDIGVSEAYSLGCIVFFCLQVSDLACWRITHGGLGKSMYQAVPLTETTCG